MSTPARAALTALLKADQAHAYATAQHERYEAVTVLVALLTAPQEATR